MWSAFIQEPCYSYSSRAFAQSRHCYSFVQCCSEQGDDALQQNPATWQVSVSVVILQRNQIQQAQAVKQLHCDHGPLKVLSCDLHTYVFFRKVFDM